MPRVNRTEEFCVKSYFEGSALMSKNKKKETNMILLTYWQKTVLTQIVIIHSGTGYDFTVSLRLRLTF